MKIRIFILSFIFMEIIICKTYATNYLPEELWLKVLSLLESPYLIKSRRVSKDFKRIIENNAIYHRYELDKEYLKEISSFKVISIPLFKFLENNSYTPKELEVVEYEIKARWNTGNKKIKSTKEYLRVSRLLLKKSFLSEDKKEYLRKVRKELFYQTASEAVCDFIKDNQLSLDFFKVFGLTRESKSYFNEEIFADGFKTFKYLKAHFPDSKKVYYVSLKYKILNEYYKSIEALHQDDKVFNINSLSELENQPGENIYVLKTYLKVAEYYEKGSKVFEKDEEKAFERYRELALLDSFSVQSSERKVIASAQYSLGKMYLEGRGTVFPDEERAFELYRQAAQAGHFKANYEIAKKEENTEKAIDYLEYALYHPQVDLDPQVELWSVYNFMNKSEKASYWLNEAMRIRNFPQEYSKIEILFAFGFEKEKQGEFARSLEFYEKAYQIPHIIRNKQIILEYMKHRQAHETVFCIPVIKSKKINYWNIHCIKKILSSNIQYQNSSYKFSVSKDFFYQSEISLSIIDGHVILSNYQYERHQDESLSSILLHSEKLCQPSW